MALKTEVILWKGGGGSNVFLSGIRASVESAVVELAKENIFSSDIGRAVRSSGMSRCGSRSERTR